MKIKMTFLALILGLLVASVTAARGASKSGTSLGAQAACVLRERTAQSGTLEACVPKAGPLLFIPLLITPAATVQQQSRRPTPTLTTEDVRANQPSPSPDKDKATAQATPPTQRGKEPNPAEQAWNKKLSETREKAKELERRADQTELEINRLRNFLFSAEPRDPGTNAQINQRISELTELTTRLRAEAKAAQEEVAALVKEGEAKGYQVESLPPTTETGKPNLEYYRKHFAELQSELQDAQAHAQVMQLRINDLRFRINNNARSGDNFFLGRLQGELQEAEKGLESARARIAEASQQLEELLLQARRAGLSLGELK